MDKYTVIAQPDYCGQPSAGVWVRVSDFLVLTKARINIPVVATTGVGFAFHADIIPNLFLFLHTLFGTLLVAASAAIANQARELSFDQNMIRTRNRPLAAGRLKYTTAVWMCASLLVSGCLWLGIAVNFSSLLYAGLAFFIYAFIYTPLKRVTPFCTFFGAVSGALPVLIGWAATGTGFGVWTFVAFTLLFVWQIPHFLAIAWRYQADYRHAGYKVLPQKDSHGYRTASWSLVFTIVLIATSLIPVFLQRVNHWYWSAVLVAGIAIGSAATRFLMIRTEASAQRLFVATLVYLPAVYSLMLLCKIAP